MRSLRNTALMAAAICSAASLATCTVHTFERKIRETPMAPAIAERAENVAVAFVFVAEKDMEASTKSPWVLAKATLLGGFLGLWPFPLDFRWARTPAIAENWGAGINATFDQEFTDQLNQELHAQTIVPPAAPTIKTLLNLAQQNGKKNAYVVVYNHYKRIVYEVSSRPGNRPPPGPNDVQTNADAFENPIYTFGDVKGYIPFMSRMLISADGSEVLINKQRLSETYFMMLLSNGWDQGFKIDGPQYESLKAYIKKVAAEERGGAIRKAVQYMIETDFAGGDGSY
ncbi:MAG: hypothetical protein JNM27_04245 [Leptospirales bacterium]|nr:hypothetical protein [Leptospirales bacterium]